ncbi:Radical SAM domain protein [Desulfarculus baarsii DSM 2075]|uniref:Radical SAM domain protein n=1 Tax=Desulfarculus baarsii (strain ATCC 33931 / DSM 2075 / LMG 7858 / VKM B-1802 / 2st14) TaxID=644282 RepID=E1QIB5_DESB2|nr:radical SAM protein [Desulfarculus baarsii]ADK85432.1 Radical SAM domain protein [Desulfarculus baarsii DSM 2075]
MTLPEPQGFDYVGNCIRPPSEANSILIQATLGCSHNKCAFCGTYYDKRFGIKDRQTLEQDLRFAQKHCRRQDRVFVMDGDALIMPMAHWEWLLGQIREKLPWVRRVGSYANSKSIAMKSDDDLRRLRELGLGILYYGVESGHPDVLRDIKKGADPEKLITQGRRAKAAGMKVSVTVLLGVGGAERSQEHARATGQLLTAMDPDYVGALTLMLIPGTPMGDAHAAGQFKLPDAKGMLMELREMLANTDLSDGLFFANHASNYLPIKAYLPADKQKALELIDGALSGRVGLKPEWMRAL